MKIVENTVVENVVRRDPGSVDGEVILPARPESLAFSRSRPR